MKLSSISHNIPSLAELNANFEGKLTEHLNQELRIPVLKTRDFDVFRVSSTDPDNTQNHFEVEFFLDGKERVTKCDFASEVEDVISGIYKIKASETQTA